MPRGWVYVMSNPSLPELVKVGFSLKDPQLRARELAQAGVPHDYVVEYEALVPEPHAIEQSVHKHLQACREKKEWFRCAPERAVQAIRTIAGSQVILETEGCREVTSELSQPIEIEPEEPIRAEARVLSKGSTSCGNKHSGVRTSTPREYASSTISNTAVFGGTCVNCGALFTVTLVRYEAGAVCPECHTYNDVAGFSRTVFGTSSTL